MLTYRLTGTTEATGVDHDEPHHDRRHVGPTATAHKRRIFAHHGAPRRRRRIADQENDGKSSGQRQIDQQTP
jgi:hypothetical protein